MTQTPPGKNTSVPIWAVVPASGVGSRMSLSYPKQYLVIHKKTILEHTLNALTCVDALAGIVLVVNDADSHYKTLDLSGYKNVHCVHGGATRAESVYNGIRYVQRQLTNLEANQSWALVHDCARPCVRPSTIQTLISTCLEKNTGGLLAVKVPDTVKIAKNIHNTPSPQVSHTHDRSLVWLAQTPQLFGVNTLLQALEYCKTHKLTVTDEASAVEQLGEQVLLVEGLRDNIKITRPEDIEMAKAILSHTARP